MAITGKHSVEPGRAEAARPELAPSDRQLVRRSLEGQQEAFGELVWRYQAVAYAVAWRILKRREDAEDAVQEAFVRAWRALRQFDATREFRPWILRIVMNVALTSASRRRAQQATVATTGGEEPLARSAESPVEAASRRELVQKLGSLAAGLSPENGLLFELRYGQEMAVEEIAQVTAQKPGTVAVALHRLRERFRRALFGDESRGETLTKGQPPRASGDEGSISVFESSPRLEEKG